MFEPRPFSDKSSAQDNLIIALKNRDLPAFEKALADPDVDPDYWYGKPYWSTCLQLAAKTQGCEQFVLALLRAGAGSKNSQRNSTPHAAKPSVNGHGDGVGDSPPECMVCAAQGQSAVGAGMGAGGVGVDASGARALGRAPHGGSWSTSGMMTPLDSPDQQTTLFWLRDLGRTVREMSEYIGSELRTLSFRVAQLDERVGAMERAQKKTNELLQRR